MVAPRADWKLQVPRVPSGGATNRLEVTLARHGPAIRGMLRRMLGNGDEAHDVYQDCLCHLLDRARSTVIQNFGAYARQTAANLAVETIRRRQRRLAHWDRIVTAAHQAADPTGDDPSRTQPGDTAIRNPELRRAVHTLPPHLRDVVVLRDLMELPYATVGRMLSIRPTTARVYRRQAIVRLGSMLGDDG
ncbi:MAG: sigma-70 family RNA polymerase sigma factor [Planctomycetes bacterium]|nr:sigma-70 family RNA polymerase sigma factor [Planctomycetota bacterium]